MGGAVGAEHVVVAGAEDRGNVSFSDVLEGRNSYSRATSIPPCFSSTATA